MRNNRLFVIFGMTGMTGNLAGTATWKTTYKSKSAIIVCGAKIMLFFLFSVSSTSTFAESTNNAASVFGLALVKEVQFPSDYKSDIRGISFSLLEEYRKSIYGLGVGLGISSFETEMKGLGISVIGSDANTVAGVQIGGFGNVSVVICGVQIAGLMNINCGDNDAPSFGLQIAGFGNSSDGLWGEPTEKLKTDPPTSVFMGGQIALFGNRAANLNGVQIASYNNAWQCSGVQMGVVNHTQNLYGLQIGVVNFAENGVGVQIGICNIFGQNDWRRVLPLINWRF